MAVIKRAIERGHRKGAIRLLAEARSAAIRVEKGGAVFGMPCEIDGKDQYRYDVALDKTFQQGDRCGSLDEATAI